MAQTGPIVTSFPYGDISRMVKHNHMQIMALFQVYLGSPHDSRQAIQELILRQLASHLDREKELLFQEIRRLGPQGGMIVREAELETKKSRL